MKLAVLDLGGTHIRLAAADLEGGRVTNLSTPVVAKTAEFRSLPEAWAYLIKVAGLDRPSNVAVAVACPTEDPILKLTNLDWTICKATVAQELGVEQVHIVNDFAAVCYAVLETPAQQFTHICGASQILPHTGVVSVVGPGTGLGVAQIVRSEGQSHVLPTEAGHISFAPCDDFEDELLARLRARLGRVSAERVASGPGLVEIYNICATGRGTTPPAPSDQHLWTQALEGSDSLASEALDRFCKILGKVAGDIALAQGAHALVIAGGIGLKLADRLAGSTFKAGLIDKGRFRARLEEIPVHVLTAEYPGLLGAAVSVSRAPLFGGPT
jgi:glucokinase